MLKGRLLILFFSFPLLLNKSVESLNRRKITTTLTNTDEVYFRFSEICQKTKEVYLESFFVHMNISNSLDISKINHDSTKLYLAYVKYDKVFDYRATTNMIFVPFSHEFDIYQAIKGEIKISLFFDDLDLYTTRSYAFSGYSCKSEVKEYDTNPNITIDLQDEQEMNVKEFGLNEKNVKMKLFFDADKETRVEVLNLSLKVFDTLSSKYIQKTLIEGEDYLKIRNGTINDRIFFEYTIFGKQWEKIYFERIIFSAYYKTVVGTYKDGTDNYQLYIVSTFVKRINNVSFLMVIAMMTMINGGCFLFLFSTTLIIVLFVFLVSKKGIRINIPNFW